MRTSTDNRKRTHRKTAQTVLMIAFAIVAAIAMLGVESFAQGGADPNTAPNPYHVDEGWAKLPQGRKWGAAIGVDIARDGKSVWVFDRCASRDDCSGSDLAPIQKFDASGKLVTSFGAGMFNYPHGLFVDRDDNVWVSDGRGKNGKGHTVMKFSPDGKLLITLGKPGVAGDGPDTFNAPSDILVAPNGDIFVADGHGGDTNARIVKLSKNGKFIKAWGKKGSAPGEFDTPHSLAMDSNGRLFVADRSNSRIQIFDQDGKFLGERRQFGRPSGIFIDKNDVIYVADSTSNDQTNPGYKQGIRIGSVRDGKVTAFIPWPETNTLEGVAADDEGNVYAGFTNTMNFRRFVKGQSPVAKAQTRIRLATLVPSGTSYHHSLQAMGAKWKQASGGTVSLTIYADGTMGSEPETVRRMRIGQLQAAVLTVAGLSEIDPATNALQKMPLMFRSLDEAVYVRTKLAPELERRLAEKGFVVLFWADAGWVRFFSKQQAVLPQDFRKMKFLVSAGDNTEAEAFKALGFNPVLLEWSDALTGLQTGMVNGLATVPVHALASQFFQVTHHMLEVNWLPLVGALIVTRASWDALPPAEREAMLHAATECGQEFQTHGRQENQEALEAMKKRGLQVHAVGPEVEREWHQFGESTYPQVRGHLVPAEMFDEVVQILRDYRAGQGATGK